MGAPRHRKAKWKNICRYCHQEFAAKMPATSICYSDECQKQKARDDAKRRKAKRANG
jgi:hypothetical protein